MERKLQTELPSVEEIQKFYLTLPVVNSPAPILFSNAQSSQHPPPLHSTDPHRRKNNLLGAIIKASLECVVSYTALAPLERVKLLLQTQNEQIRSGRLPHPYRGIKDCLCRTIKHEGLLSLWRGNLAHIALLFQTQAVRYAYMSYPSSDEDLKKDEHRPRNASAGAIAAVAYFILSNDRLFTYPLDFGRTRLSCDVKQAHGSWQFTTLIDTYQKMLKSNGIAGVYRGYTVALCAELADFLIEPLMKTKFPRQDDRQTAVYVHAPISMTTQLALYPFDTVCRRMMMTAGEEARYMGVVDAFKQIVKREGLSSLYKGMGADIIRISAVYCLILSTTFFDITKK